MSQKSYNNSPTLYLIPTPIGNLEDMTLRSINILKSVDVVFCEDTRVTGLLLNQLNISKKLVSSHKFNESNNKEKLLSYLKDGKNVGLVSDRGTPVISDPGYELAKCAIDNNYNVVGLPGATALIPALIMSGLDSNHFYYYGFLNSKDSQRKKELEELKNIKSTLIFYEAPHRIEKALKDMSKILGNNRRISISREISKKFEEVYRGTIEELLEQKNEYKGEIVIVVEGNKNLNQYKNLSVKEHVDMYISDGKSVMDAIKIVAKERNVKKSSIYTIYHDLEEE